MKCDFCDGKGGWREDMGEGTILFEPCPFCDETGRITFKRWLWDWFWLNMPVWFTEWYSDRKYPK